MQKSNVAGRHFAKIDTLTRVSFKTAIVGCGRMGGLFDRPKDEGFVDSHIQAYRRHSKFKPDIAVDNELERLEQFKKVWKIPETYSSLTDLLKRERLDVVSLCTPTEVHASQIEEMLNSKNKPKVIFVEKPVCVNRKELNRLIKLAENNGSLIIVNHTRRFDPGHIRLRQFIAKKELGAFLGGRCDYYGGWLNNGSHAVDTLRMLLGEEPIIKSAKEAPGGRGEDKCLDVEILFGKAPVEIISFDESYYEIFEIELRFEKGRALIRDFGAEIIIERAKRDSLGKLKLLPDTENSFKGLDSPIYHAVDAIADYLEKGSSIRGRGVLLKETYETMDVLWKAIEKSR